MTRGGEGFLRTLCTLRWLALAGQSAAVLVALGPLDLHLPRWPLWGGIAALALFNLFALWRARRVREASPREGFLHILVDMAALAWLVAWSGGLVNPFVSLLLLPVALAALALPPRWAVATGVAAVLAFVAAAMLAPDVHTHGGQGVGFDLHLWGMAVNFLITVAMVLVFSLRLVERLRARERELADLRERFVRNEGIVALATHAASVAHELNTPLGTFTLVLDDLLEQPATPDAQADLQTLRALVDVMRARVRTLAEAADPAAAAPEPLERLILRWQLVRPGIELQRRGDAPDALRLEAGVAHLLLALLNNAADASQAAGASRVELDLRCAAGWLDGRVRDHGAGFDPEHPPLPGRFGSGKPDGLGVGLALSHATIERLGGALTLSAADGGGAEVRFRVPMAGCGAGPA